MRNTPLPKIDWLPTESSNVDAVFWDAHTETACVRFKAGGVYTYMGVPQEVYMDMIHAPSIGRYLNNVLKAFPYTRHENETALLAHLNH